MIRLCLFVTGPVGCGKTTLVRRLGLMGWRTLHTGDLWVQRKAQCAKGENIVAPHSFDKVVYAAIEDLLGQTKADPICFLALECVPRSTAQIAWVKQLADKYRLLPIVLVLDAPSAIREMRVKSRDLYNIGRTTFDLERMQSDPVTFDAFQKSLVAMCASDSVQLAYANTASADPGQWPTGKCDVEQMTAIARDFFMERRVQAGNPDFRVDVRHILERAKDELEEALEAASENWRLEEIVDVLWFCFLALSAMNVNSAALMEAYIKKAIVNGYRQDHDIKPLTRLAVL